MGGCHDKAPADGVERAVSVGSITHRVMAHEVTAGGVLMPREEVEIRPEIQGYRVRQLLVDENDSVAAGQPLAILDGQLLEGDVSASAANLGRHKALLELATLNAERAQRLKNSGFLATSQFDQRQSEARATRADVEAASAQLAQLRVRQTKLVLRAPVAGVVLERSAKLGYISDPTSQTPMFRLARDGQVEMYAEVPNTALSQVRIGQSVHVRLANGAVVTGRVRLVSPRINPQTVLGTVRIELPPRPDVRVGGFARAVLRLSERSVATVPETAIRYNASGPSLMIVSRDLRVIERPAVLGERSGDVVEIMNPPADDARIVLTGSAFVLPGEHIRVTTR